MFCTNCGKEIDNNAVICVHCGVATGKQMSNNESSGRSWVAALLLCLFLGGLGAHRFYVGKTGSGVAMLLITILLGWVFGLGLLITGIWAIIDLIMICTGAFKAADGKELKK